MSASAKMLGVMFTWLANRVLQFAEAIRGRGVEHHIGAATLDRGGRGRIVDAGAHDDLVGVAVRARGSRPLVKVRVSDQCDLCGRGVRDLVRPRGRDRVHADVVKGCARRYRRRVREREPVEELGAGHGEMEGDGVRLIVDDHASREIATRRAGYARGAADHVREVVAGERVS